MAPGDLPEIQEDLQEHLIDVEMIWEAFEVHH